MWGAGKPDYGAQRDGERYWYVVATEEMRY